ncbi:MAG: GpE family phage tail protein [Acidobacteriia bacterium]|nr:GpE family phage tail protein [Terriglobia bacterium]MYG04272.1 GpE family phage tail protein [Terriglobia bacterium]MYK11419.1 GpE family phage tail protein [Terriglobia bacterium]
MLTLRERQADIATVFHSQPSEMKALPRSEAMEYRRLAVERATALTTANRGGRR